VAADSLAVASPCWIAAAGRYPVAGAVRNRIVTAHRGAVDHSQAPYRPFCRLSSRPTWRCTLATVHRGGTSSTGRFALHQAARLDKDEQFPDRRPRETRLHRHPAAAVRAAWVAASPVPASPAPAACPPEAEAGRRSARTRPAQPKPLLQGKSNVRCGVPCRPAPCAPAESCACLHSVLVVVKDILLVPAVASAQNRAKRRPTDDDVAATRITAFAKGRP
jgi:hypothetical protein